jgi:phosphate starvation-inducible PhoH-like protein
LEAAAKELLVVDSTDHFMALFGVRDENVDLIRRELGVEIFAHGNEIAITGAPDKAKLAKLVMQKLVGVLSHGEPIDKSRIRYAIELASEGNADRIEEIMRDVIAITYKGRQVKCRTLGQSKYVDAIKSNTCVFAVGPAGTGKTYLAIAMAVVALKNKDVERIILTRPAVEAGEKLGFLPGDLQQKVDPYLRPLYDALNDMMGAEAYQRLHERGVVEVRLELQPPRPQAVRA